MASFINRSETGSAVSFIINCGDEIKKKTLDDLSFIVKRIDEMKDILFPMRVEIFAAAKKLSNEIFSNNDDESVLPCTVLTNEGHYLRKAVKFAHSNPVVIMDSNVVPTMEHMYFFQREIPRDLIFYFAERQELNEQDDVKNETLPSLATFQFVDSCEKNDNAQLKNMDFIVATKDTWLSVKVPPAEYNIHDWLMRLRSGYVSIKFESPVWSWGESMNSKIDEFRDASELCCYGMINDQKKIKSGDTFIHYGKRRLIQ